MHHCQICGVVFDIKLQNKSFERPAKRQRVDESQESEPTAYDNLALRSTEWKGINDMQCIVTKFHTKGAPPTDLFNYEFEKTSNTFVTGVCTCEDKSTNNTTPHHHGHAYTTEHRFLPCRYNVSTIDSSNVTAAGMPMHPACFEIFKLVSKRKFGFIDIDGLYFLRNKESDSAGFISLKRGPDVDKCRKRDRWIHYEGTEYLAANPIQIPNLENAMSNCPFAMSDYAFEPVLPEPKPTTPKGDDPFLRLLNSAKNGDSPGQRIIDTIIMSLPDKKSLCNIRSTSRAFRRVPQTYFKRVFVQEYSKCFFEMFDENGQIHRMPTDWGVDSRSSESKIDWLGFYKEVKGLKGLTNRQRIWKDTLLICERIRKMHAKEANKVGDTPSAPLQQLKITSSNRAEQRGGAMSVSA